MKRVLKLVSLAVACQVATGSAHAYETPNHFDFAQQAISVSELISDPNKAANLGLKPGWSDKFPDSDLELTDHPDTDMTGCTHGQTMSPLNLLMCGAQYEDEPAIVRAINHFYDSWYNRPLEVWGMSLPAAADKQPDWALEDRGEKVHQYFSYKDAREYFYKALTSMDGMYPERQKQIRDQNWGKMFQSLGMVLHAVADSAAPQHVRNDQHLTLESMPFLYNPSLFENYARNNRSAVKGYGAGATAVFSEQTQPVSAYTTPRKFFDDPVAGLNQFTNQNFFSDGTNFNHDQGQLLPAEWFPLPIPSFPEWGPTPIADLVPPVNPEVLGACPTCVMHFVESNRVTANPYRDTPLVYNDRAASYSIYNKYVNNRPYFGTPFRLQQTDMVPTLNRYNFDKQLQLLSPRAVAYSAGLINYFFRGKLEISLPDEKVYAIVDHQPGALGFSKIKAKVKLSGTLESTGSGTLVAVAKFHRNTCYTDSLSGELGAEPSPGTSCRTPHEEIAVSNAHSISAGGLTNTDQDFTFQFTADSIPLSATDLYLQVVYKGQLGEETEAVVVGTKDISEPTFDLGFYNSYEQNLFGSGGCAFCYTIIDDPDYVPGSGGAYSGFGCCSSGVNLMTFEQYYCVEMNDSNCYTTNAYTSHYRFAPPPSGFDSNNPSVAAFESVVSFPNIAVGDYGRVAILTDVGASLELHRLLELPRNGWVGDYAVDTYKPAKVQAEPGTDTISQPTRYRMARGIYGTDTIYNDLMTGGAYVKGYPVPDMHHLAPQPATINFASP